MSRVVGRSRSIREATVSWALPHLQLATLPGTRPHRPPTSGSLAPGEGGRPCKWAMALVRRDVGKPVTPDSRAGERS